MLNRRAVFLDKDGTVIENVPYNVDPDRLRLAPGAAEGLRALHEAGFLLIVVSNQSGVARGYFEESALGAVEHRLRSLLAAERVPLADFFYCPHHPAGSVADYAKACSCRKPAPGLLMAASEAWAIDRRRSWMIGDRPEDIEAGRRADCRTIQIGSIPKAGPCWSFGPKPDAQAADLAEAARWITALEAQSNRPFEPTFKADPT